MTCPSCAHENRPGAKFCEECGTPLKRACASCGGELRPTAKFCDECGGEQGDNGSTRGLTLGNALGAGSRSVTSPCCGSRSAGGRASRASRLIFLFTFFPFSLLVAAR